MTFSIPAISLLNFHLSENYAVIMVRGSTFPGSPCCWRQWRLEKLKLNNILEFLFFKLQLIFFIILNIKLCNWIHIYKINVSFRYSHYRHKHVSYTSTSLGTGHKSPQRVTLRIKRTTSIRNSSTSFLEKNHTSEVQLNFSWLLKKFARI